MIRSNNARDVDTRDVTIPDLFLAEQDGENKNYVPNLGEIEKMDSAQRHNSL